MMSLNAWESVSRTSRSLYRAREHETKSGPNGGIGYLFEALPLNIEYEEYKRRAWF